MGQIEEPTPMKGDPSCLGRSITPATSKAFLRYIQDSLWLYWILRCWDPKGTKEGLPRYIVKVILGSRKVEKGEKIYDIERGPCTDICCKSSFEYDPKRQIFHDFMHGCDLAGHKRKKNSKSRRVVGGYHSSSSPPKFLGWLFHKIRVSYMNGDHAWKIYSTKIHVREGGYFVTECINCKNFAMVKVPFCFRCNRLRNEGTADDSWRKRNLAIRN